MSIRVHLWLIPREISLLPHHHRNYRRPIRLVRMLRPLPQVRHHHPLGFHFNLAPHHQPGRRPWTKRRTQVCNAASNPPSAWQERSSSPARARSVSASVPDVCAAPSLSKFKHWVPPVPLPASSLTWVQTSNMPPSTSSAFMASKTSKPIPAS